ncbi:U1 zinc finger domain containing protein [Nitzschia inconspicua]|uniref:U1 zinc finger domain containing protein n=1 Tax=Nitzschia inconspicua TaxID=303405 RepID=A0A9K3LJ49_9STRA|nr:U1 zinc finger domain containing protein [Nitzschia inconspicua]
MSSQQQKRRAPWQNVERHYCAVCNAWMGSDRQSIMLHENGKKHQQNAERALLEKRKEKKEEEEASRFLADSLRQMEQAALQATGMSGQPTSQPLLVHSYPLHRPIPQHVTSSAPIPGPPPKQNSQHPKQNANDKQQLKEWQARKKQKEELEKKRKQHQDGDYDQQHSQPSNKRHKISPGEGHYSVDGDDSKTYMEAQVFFGLLQVDMPVQLWTGSNLATPQEKRLPANSLYWKNALVLSARQPISDKDQTTGVTGSIEPVPIIHVTYLASPDAIEETIEKNVALDRIRIQLGADESIPDTLEEARLLAMGGEVVEKASVEEQVVDEATGLSGWSVVSVKKTTVRQYDREEKEQVAEKLRLARLEREAERRKMEERRLEEAKLSNADDSALGAYDVWGKGDYKGIDISRDTALSVEDTAKKLAAGNSGGPVSFRKAKKKNKGMLRKTNIEDD